MPSRLPLLACMAAFLALTAVVDETGMDSRQTPAQAPEPMHFESTGSVTVAGRNIEYTATAGTLVMKNEKDEPIAEFGYTAYIQKGKDKTNRPIMFAYNGGPGSA